MVCKLLPRLPSRQVPTLGSTSGREKAEGGRQGDFLLRHRLLGKDWQLPLVSGDGRRIADYSAAHFYRLSCPGNSGVSLAVPVPAMVVLVLEASLVVRQQV